MSKFPCLVAAVLMAAGCVDSADVSDVQDGLGDAGAQDGPGRHGPDPVTAEGVSDPLVGGQAVSCQATATIDPVARTVNVTVRFACDPLTQVHDWTRLGILVDGSRFSWTDLTYVCGGEVTADFPLDGVAEDAVIEGGAVFDHPTTRADVTCLDLAE